jgi:hypothetical protein
MGVERLASGPRCVSLNTQKRGREATQRKSPFGRKGDLGGFRDAESELTRKYSQRVLKGDAALAGLPLRFAQLP